MGGFREYIQDLESEGHVVRVKRPVDAQHGLAAIQWQIERQLRKAVIFESPAGYDAVVAGNLYLVPLRMGITPTVPMMEELLAIYNQIRKPGIVYPLWAMSNMFIPMYKEVEQAVVDALNNPIAPEYSDTNELVRVIREGIDLGRLLPIPQYFREDAGRYITAGVTLAKDPTTGYLNAGVYRIQVLGGNRLAIMVNVKRDLMSLLNASRRKGCKLDVAIAIGVPPALLIASTMSVPFGQSELGVAGGFTGRPLVVSPGLTVDLSIPGEAEIVIEGVIDPSQRMPEGPFTEYDLLASQQSQGFLIEVTAVRTREKPIYHSLVCTSLEMVSVIMPLGITELRNAKAFLKQISRNVQEVWLLPGVPGTGIVVSLDKEHEAEPQEIIRALFAYSARFKRIIVVDTDVDVFDPFEVQWAIDTRACYRRDFMVLKATGEATDAARIGAFSVKTGIDATKKGGHPSKMERSDVRQFENVDLAEVLDTA